MNIPGFTAEASLYVAPKYHSNGTNPYKRLRNSVIPSAATDPTVILCGRCKSGCYNSFTGARLQACLDYCYSEVC